MPQLNWDFPYPSRRMPVFARNLVATSQPLAAQAGLRMLQKGGNAVDAALATAISLTVVEPTMNGIGSDAFALVWDGNTLHGLNASGRSPAAWTFDHFAKKYTAMPTLGWDAVTIPGAVSAWAALSERFGKLPFESLFEPAVEYARSGYLIPPIVAASWQDAQDRYRHLPDFAAAFLPGGKAPGIGETFTFEAQARTLQRIAETRGDAFYRGDLAETIAAYAKKTGGWITEADLAEHRADWVEPISIAYQGHELHEIPPNGQGIAALLALGILANFDLPDCDSADSLHLQIEAMKLAFADTHRYVSDPDARDIDYTDLLAPDYLSRRARLIDPARAQTPGHGIPGSGDTVYLTTADAGGMMVSFIQSNYMGFGSGVVVPDTGISMQNRGSGFRLKKNHPNRVDGRKRPYHTIIPGFVTRNGAPVMGFGVMGGPMQPQGHAQMMIRIFGYGQNPQAACDAPRWQVFQGLDVGIEPGFAPGVLQDLADRGHRLVPTDFRRFGGGQLIYKLEDGYCGASEPRKDGQAVGF